MCIATYILKIFFTEMRISAQKFCSDQELKVDMDGEKLSHTTAVPVVVVLLFLVGLFVVCFF